jgi:hypothetical protein
MKASEAVAELAHKAQEEWVPHNGARPWRGFGRSGFQGAPAGQCLPPFPSSA